MPNPERVKLGVVRDYYSNTHQTQTELIYNSRNLKGLLFYKELIQYANIYNSRNLKGLLFINQSYDPTSIYNSRNLKGLLFPCVVIVHKEQIIILFKKRKKHTLH